MSLRCRLDWHGDPLLIVDAESGRMIAMVCSRCLKPPSEWGTSRPLARRILTVAAFVEAALLGHDVMRYFDGEWGALYFVNLDAACFTYLWCVRSLYLGTKKPPGEGSPGDRAAT